VSDLTAKARIREAAMELIGEVGYDRATTRAIAERAGVTSGLIRHHYGSKEGLLTACDEQVIHLIIEQEAKARSGQVGSLHLPAPYRMYLARALFDGRAAAVFDHMVTVAEAWMAAADATRPDPTDLSRRARATVQTAFALSVGMLVTHVSRGLGADITQPDGERLLMRVLLDLYSHPLLTPETAREHGKRAQQHDR